MSDLNKIPFGLRESDSMLVDVCDVPNGKQCGCICPSCYTPLKARQGDIKVWHFAHTSRNVYKQTKNECEYSFYPSVRLMARQIIGNQIKLSLPEYIGKIEYFKGIRWIKECKEFRVTEEKDVIIDNLEVEKTFSGAAVDIVGTINDFHFVIYFSHPDRTIPDNLYEPQNSKCGIIEISLDLLPIQFKKIRSEGKTYQEILTDFLMNDRKSKKWIYHPRFKQKANDAIEDLKRTANILECAVISEKDNNHLNYSLSQSYKNGNDNFFKNYGFNSKTMQPNKLVKFECVMCKSQWEGYEAGGNKCPKCRNYLYSKQIG